MKSDRSKIISRAVGMLVLLFAGWASPTVSADTVTYEIDDFTSAFQVFDGDDDGKGNLQPVRSAEAPGYGFEIYFETGDGKTLPAWWVADKGFRTYAGNFFYVTNAAGRVIEQITFTQPDSKKYVNEKTFTCDYGTLSFETGGVVTWTADERKEKTVLFDVGTDSGTQFRFNKMTITFRDDSSNPDPWGDTETYFLEFDNTDNWTDVHVYAWVMNADGTESEILGGWPGMSVKPDDYVNGVERYDVGIAVPVGGTPMVIFNGYDWDGNLRQTSDMLMINGGRYNCSGPVGSGSDPSVSEYVLYFDRSGYGDWDNYSMYIEDYKTGEFYEIWPEDYVTDSLNGGRSLLKYVIRTSTPLLNFRVYFCVNGSDVYSTEKFVNNGVYSWAGLEYIYGQRFVEKPKKPWFSSSDRSFTEAFEVSISHDNGAGFQVYYTLDGSTPTAETGMLYDGNGIMIPEGSNVTIKAIVVNSSGDASDVVSATYTYVPTRVLTVKVNKAGAMTFEISCSTEWGTYGNFTEKTFRVRAGDNIYAYSNMMSGYRCTGVTFDGSAETPGDKWSYYDLTMPDYDTELVFTTVYDPASPADPSSTETEKTYTLTVMFNPAGAGTTAELKNLKAGQDVWLDSYMRGYGNYLFRSFTIGGEMVPYANGHYNVTMPAADVTVFANFAYSPGNPDDPTQPELKRPLAVTAMPAGSCSFNTTASSVAVGDNWYAYAYPKTGYVFKGWLLNGVRQDGSSTYISGKMTEQGVSLVALCEYDPSSPGNPGANYYNDVTGQLIVDDFVPGQLNTAVNAALGGRGYDAVVSIIVKGRVTSADYRNLQYMSSLQAADLSRTYGVGTFASNVVAGLPVTSVILPADITSVNYGAFSGCSNLVSLSLHSTVPPTVTSSALSGFTPGNCVLRVPEESIELYRAAPVWKNFADIVPLGDAVHILEVQLPYAYRDGRLKNNRIELVNVASGRRQRYVITDRPVYTFNGVMKDEQYVVLMISESGLEMARISDILIPDADHAVAFTSIKEMCDVHASVKTPEGEDVTDRCTVEWFEVLKDETRTYLKKAKSLGKVPEGQTLVVKTTIDRDLAMRYQNPEERLFTVEPGISAVEFTLEPLRTVIATGKVTDEEGNVPTGATVTVRQKIAGKYDRSASATVDKDGNWTSVMYDAPLTTVTYAASESLARTDTVAPDMSGTLYDLGEVVMRSNVGARIAYTLSFRKAVRKGETAETSEYTDIDNLHFKVYNKSRRIQHPVSLKHGQILVLDAGIQPTDSLAVTVSSTLDDFADTSVTVEAGEDFRPSVSFDLVGKGGIYAGYGTTDSPEVAGILYDAAGKYVKKSNFTNSELTMGSLEDGDYSLVAMTRSDILNSAATLDAMQELGLMNDRDYAMRKFRVSHGVITDVEFKTVPAVDESLFTFTSSNTSITPNKTNITAGQYLTIKTILEFKPVYKGRISNVTLDFELPDKCDFVDASMMQGSRKFGYDVQGNRIVVNCGNNYAEQLRFCVMPNSAGEIAVSGRVTFDLDGRRVSQPLGTAKAISKSFDFFTPVRTCYNQIVARGAANPNSTVRIYQDGKLIGEGQSSQGGIWTVNCEMTGTYHQSEHQLQAVVTTPEGVELKSGTRRITFDGNAIMIDRVTMLTGNEEVVFDFNGVGNTQSYLWVEDRLFTFIVKLNENAPDKISDVILYVKQLDGNTQDFNCYYSQSRDAWLCVGNFTSSTAPVNVAVSIINADGLTFDRNHFDETVASKQVMLENGMALQEELDNLNADIRNVGKETEAMELVFADAMRNWENYSDSEKSEAIVRMLTASGGELPSYDYPADQLATQEEIDRLMEEALASLLPIESPDYEKFEEIMQSVADDDDYNDFKFDTADTDLKVDTELGEFNYKEIPYSDIDFSQYTEDQITELKQNDGSVVKLILTGTTWIIADESCGRAWIIETIDESPAMLKAQGDLLSVLNDWIHKVKSAYDKIKTFVDVVMSSTEAEYNAAKAARDLVKEQANELFIGKIRFERRLRIIEEQLDAMKKNAALSPEYNAKMQKEIKLLEGYRDECAHLFDQSCREYNRAAKELAKKETKFLVKKAMFDQVVGVADAIWRWVKFIDWGVSGVQDHNRWSSFISSIKPCPNDAVAADALEKEAIDFRNDLTQGYICAVSMAATSAGISTALVLMSKNPATAVATKVLGIICDFISGMVYERGKELYETTRNSSRAVINAMIERRRDLACHRDEDPKSPWNHPLPDLPGDPDGSNRTEAGNGAEKYVIIDPAGYVYEGVRSNRVEGVQATAYYREEVEDMYGDRHLNEVLWNAEEYAQENPLFTDSEGMYAWDVPPGEWRVKFEKDGYNTTYSEWLPVPPPQLEVNVEITQNSQPEVKEVHAYAEGVDITFDKYMDPETLSVSNIFVTADGDRLAGSVEMLNSEAVDTDGSARTLVSKVRFVPENKLSVTTGKVRLTINRDVKSYAGIPMTETYTQELDVEKEVKGITVGDELVKVLYGGDKSVTVSVLPSEAGMGRTLRIANSSPMITSTTEEITLNELGQGELKLTGDMPGSSVLTFTLDGTDKQGEVKVNVLEELVEAEKPTASRASGSSMYRGEKIELKSESKGAVIWFTTDGSDPADADGLRRKYSVPVVLDGDLEVKAVAEVDGEQSEVSDFTYTIKRSAMDFRPDAGWSWISHNFEAPVRPKEIAADNVKAILSQTDEVVADPEFGLVGTLTELDAAHSYKVEAEGTAAAKRVETYAFNPANAISVTTGWNWLGYPVDQELSVAEAFANAGFQAEDIIVGQEGASQYDGENWIGTLTTLKPGAGYMLLSAEDMELVYNNTSVSDARSKYAGGIPYNAPWAADMRKYAKAMVVVAEVVDNNGLPAADDEWYVGAFCGSECRGVGRWVDGMVMMNVFGQNKDEIRLRLVNADSGAEVEIDDAIEFSEKVVGSVMNPYRISTGGVNGLQSVGLTGDRKVAVVNGQLVADPCDSLELFDATGLKVLSVANYDGTPISLDSLTNGVHVVSVRNGDNYSYAKIMVK